MKTSTIAFIFCLFFGLVLLSGTISTVYRGIIFDKNCKGYLERAANANTVELAEKQMSIAVKYIEDNNLTKGYTSVLYNTPDEDLGYWYENLNAALKELREVKPEATLLERSNILMKLRETVMAHSKEGEYVIVPPGISLYPFNFLYAVWGFFSIFTLCVMLFFTIFASDIWR